MQNVAPDIMDLGKESQATRISTELVRTMPMNSGARCCWHDLLGSGQVCHRHSLHPAMETSGISMPGWRKAIVAMPTLSTSRLQPPAGSRGPGYAGGNSLLRQRLGRIPSREFDGQMGRSDDGRDHNPHGFTM